MCDSSAQPNSCQFGHDWRHSCGAAAERRIGPRAPSRPGFDGSLGLGMSEGIRACGSRPQQPLRSVPPSGRTALPKPRIGFSACRRMGRLTPEALCCQRREKKTRVKHSKGPESRAPRRCSSPHRTALRISIVNVVSLPARIMQLIDSTALVLFIRYKSGAPGTRSTPPLLRPEARPCTTGYFVQNFGALG